jgi:hypothetical protein
MRAAEGVPTDVTPTTDEYASTAVADLLANIAHGRIGVDHQVLHAILDRPDQGLPELLQWAAEDHPDDPIDVSDLLIDLFRHLKTPEAISFYVRLLRQYPDELSDEMVDALHEIKQVAVDPLIELYEELGEDRGEEIAFLLASFRIQDPRILKILTDRLEYDAADATMCLGLYGDPAAKPFLENIRLAGGVDERLNLEIDAAIVELGRPLDDHHSEFDIWAEYPERALPDFEVLSESERIGMFESASAEVRATAVSTFKNRDLMPSVRQRIFDLARRDQDAEVRGAAWEALAGEIEEHPEIRKGMMDRLRDRTAAIQERAGALVGMGSDAAKPEIRRYAEELYKEPATRAKSMQAMWRSFDRVFAPYFPQHLNDSDPEVQRQAIWGIGYLVLTAEAEKLTKFFEDDELRADALFAYALSARHEVSRGRIHSLFRRIQDLAGGLSEGEDELVKMALDERLQMNGYEPVFRRIEEDPEPAPEPVEKPGRNDPCPCGSGKKYKKCCGQ